MISRRERGLAKVGPSRAATEYNASLTNAFHLALILAIGAIRERDASYFMSSHYLMAHHAATYPVFIILLKIR